MKAPDFKLPDQEGRLHCLLDFKGKWLILYFYPKDFTPGCTKEACSFRDSLQEFKKLGVEVIGISKDSVNSHQKFSQKFNLNFTLFSDPEHKVIEVYGAWGKKKFLGKEFFGTIRSTFIINPKGEIAKEYKKVNPLAHTRQVLADITNLL